MAKQILIDSWFGMVRTAIAENNALVDYYEESSEQGRNKGNIYRGVVKRVDAPIQAAFVKFAGGRDGFLPLRDASAGKPPKPGDTVLVQVVKDEVGDKGAALTSKLSLSGRYLVYIPERDGEGGISSKVTDDERAALKKAVAELQIPEGASVILRTAASDKGVAELQADLDRLVETHREILDKFSQGKEPGLLFREAPPALRYLREYYTEEVERIWVNQEEVQDQCRQFFYLYEPKSAAKVVLSQDGPLLFQRLGLEAEVEKLSARRVALPSGANIVIDQAEALVAIDVNSAKAGGRAEEPKGRRKGGKGGKGGGLEDTVFAVNKEAAAEIARQLRLRDLGGIIIVDFIDMEEEKHRRQVEEAMRKALSGDKAKVKVFDISPLGIMQISRQRLRKAGHQFSRHSCEDCQGRGWHPSPSAGALAALRKLEERLHGKKAGQTLIASVPYPVANKLMNEFREHIVAMERRYGCSIRLNALPEASGEPSIASPGGGEPAGRTDRVGPAQAQGQERKERGPERNAPEAGRREGPGAKGRGPDRRAEDGQRSARGAQADRGGPDAEAETRRNGRGRSRRGGRGRSEDAATGPAAGPYREPATEAAVQDDRLAERAMGGIPGEGDGAQPWETLPDGEAFSGSRTAGPASGPVPGANHPGVEEPEFRGAVAVAEAEAPESGMMTGGSPESKDPEEPVDAPGPEGAAMEGAAPGAVAPNRGRRGRRGGRGRGRGKGNGGRESDGSARPASVRKPESPKAESRKAASPARPQTRGGAPRAEGKGAGRPRRRGGRKAGGPGAKET